MRWPDPLHGEVDTRDGVGVAAQRCTATPERRPRREPACRGPADGAVCRSAGLLEAAVRSAVPPLVTAAWTLSWSPADLYQLARRRLDAQGVGYPVDAIADQARRDALTGGHDR